MAENTIEIEVDLVGQKETLRGLDKVKEGAEGIGESFKGVGDLVGKTNQQLGEGLASVSDAVGGSIEAFSGMATAIKGVNMSGAGLIGLIGPIGAVTGAVALAYEAFRQLTGAAQEAEDMAEAVAAAAGDLQSKLEALAEGGIVLASEELRSFTRLTLDAQIAKERLQKSYERLQKSMERELKAQEALAKAQKEVERLTKATGSASMGLAGAINEQTRAERELALATTELNSKLAGLEARQIAVNKAIAQAAEAQEKYEELTKDALKTKALELSERQKSLEIMEAERFLQDDLTELSAQKIIAEQEAAKRKLAIEQMTREELLKNVSATERLLSTSQEATQIELANSRAVQQVYAEQAKKRAEMAKAERARRGAEAKMAEAMARQQIALESQLRQLEIQLYKEGLDEREALARERYETGLELAQDNATKRAIVETQYQLEIQQIKDAELEADYQRITERQQRDREALEESKRFAMERVRIEQEANQQMSESVIGYFDELGKGFVEASLGALMFGDSFKSSIKDVLESLARQAGVKSLMEFAEAAAYSFSNPILAAQHAKAGGIYAAAAIAAKGAHSAMGGGGGGAGGGATSPSGSALSAPAPQREQASTESMVFNVNFGGAVIYDTKRAAEQALADRVVETLNRPRRGAVRLNSRG